MNFPRLSKPPITEALLDIRVNLPKEIGLDNLRSLHQEVSDFFPKCEERFEVEGCVEIKKGQAQYAPMKHKIMGYLFRSEEKGKIVQARLDGYTFNKLKPYESWDALVEDARKYWNLYIGVAKPTNVTRIAVRYINRIDIPMPFGDFREYILTAPELAPSLPQELSEFLFRVVLPNEKINAVAIITETIKPHGPGEANLPLIFDIDVSKIVNLKTDDELMWRDFEELRRFKNEIFFNSLTTKTLELLK